MFKILVVMYQYDPIENGFGNYMISQQVIEFKNENDAVRAKGLIEDDFKSSPLSVRVTKLW